MPVTNFLLYACICKNKQGNTQVKTNCLGMDLLPALFYFYHFHALMIQLSQDRWLTRNGSAGKFSLPLECTQKALCIEYPLEYFNSLTMLEK